MTDLQIFERFLSAGLLVCSACIGLAAASVVQTLLKPSSRPAGTELAFLVGVQKDLMKRFPAVADALKAGYFRCTSEDASGSIGYANLRWQSTDPQHPSQLWYDVHGNLLGADFSVLASESKMAPSVWGVQPRRWFFGRAHICYILERQNGTETYGLVSSKKFAAAGGNTANPDAETLVRLGVVSKVGEVRRIFPFPTLWDLRVCVKPNATGTFAYMHPPVTHALDWSDGLPGTLF